MPGVGRTSILLSAAGGHGRAGRARASLRQLLEVGGDVGASQEVLDLSIPLALGLV